MKFVVNSTPAENANITFEQAGPRTVITIRQRSMTSDGYPDDDTVTIVSVLTEELATIASVFKK